MYLGLRAVAVNQRPRDPADQSVPGLRPGATRRTLSPGATWQNM